MVAQAPKVVKEVPEGVRPARHHGGVRRLVARLPKRVLRRLPARLAVPALSELGWPRADTRDLSSITLPAPFRLDVYWLTIHGEQGPAASLFHGDDEILRIDCLPANPHLHYGLAESRRRQPREPRVYLPPGPPAAQIERARFEVARNVAYCTGLDRRRSVRRAPIDRPAFAAAADEMARTMHALVERRAP